MAEAVFPTLRSLGWSVFKTPSFNTIIKTAVSGKEVRAARMTNPIWEFRLTYEVIWDRPAQINPDLGDTDLRAIMGFFLARKGSFESFLFLDPNDYVVNGQVLTPDASNALRYQCVRNMGGFLESIQAVGGVTAIYFNGAAQNVALVGFLDVNGGFNFYNPIAGGTVVSADFTFYYRVRFGTLQGGDGDSLEFEQFAYQLWTCKQVAFVSAKT